MEKEKSSIDITESEWYVLDALWDHAPQTARELTENLKKSVGWSRSTTLTMLRRMTDKGFLRCETDAQNLRIYSPFLARDVIRMRETEHFLERIYGGSISMMLSAMSDGKKLDDKEIAALYEVLRQAEQKK